MTSLFKTNKMKSSLLLILALITGCESLSEGKTCTEGWVQFTCNNRKPKVCKMAPSVRGNVLKLSTEITNSSGKQKLQFEVEENGCPKPFYQNVNKTDTAIITCDYPDTYTSYFFCKQSGSSCKDLLSGKSHQKPKITVKSFSVSSRDAGVYWCGIRSDENKFLLKQIQLKVIVNFTRSAVTGQKFSYWCKYNDSSLTKFICKGEDPSTCRLLVNTTNAEMNMKFSMNDDKMRKNISITVREVTEEDSGTYWCGAESSDKQRFFINKLLVTVVSPTPPAPAPPAASSAAAITAGTHGVSEAVTAVIVGAAVLPSLLLLIVLVLLYKRFPCSKHTGNRAEEECTYEEIQEHLQPPEPATSTIYATVNPPSRAASTHYAVISFQTSDTAAEALKPSSACQYSAVRFTTCSTSSSVTQLHQTTEEPLYSTVNKSLKKSEAAL